MRFILTFLLVFTLFSVHAQFSNWTQLLATELEGGDVRDYLYHNNTVYAGSRGGVFKTTNNGISWVNMNNNIAQNNAVEINGLAVLNDTIFAATVYGLAKSSDGGQTWTACTDPGGVRQYIDRVVTLGNYVVVTAKSFSNEWKMYRSFDYGKTWQNGGHTFTKRPHIYKIKNDRIYIDRADTLYYTTDGLLFNTMNTTNNLPNGHIIDNLCGDSAASSNYIYAIINYSNIRRLNLTTLQWEDSCNTISPQRELYGLYYFDGKLIVCGVDYTPHFNPELFITYDKGKSWLKMPAPFGVKYPLLQKAVWMGGTNLMATYYYENYFSDNGGLNWGKRASGMYASRSSQTIGVGSSLLTALGYQGVLRSTDNGLNWSPSNAGIDSPFIFTESLNQSSTHIYASLRLHIGDSMKLYRSANGGLNWQRCNLPTGVESFDFIGAADSTIFIRNRTGSNLFVYRSINHGDTFVNVNSNLPAVFTQGSGVLQSIVGARDTVMALGMDAFKLSKIYISKDNGDTYTEVNSGIPNVVGSTVMKILAGDSFFVAVVRNVNDSLKYFAEGSWVGGKGQNLPEQPRLYTVDKIGNRFFALTNRGVYVSSNTGYSWVFVDNPPGAGAAINRFLANSQYLFVATENNGLYRNSLQVGVEEKNTPFVFHTTAYPNPANTSVSFQLVSAGGVTLQLVDMQGRVVSQQTNPQPLFDVSFLREGLYVYRITTAEGTTAGKLLIQH